MTRLLLCLPLCLLVAPDRYRPPDPGPSAPAEDPFAAVVDDGLPFPDDAEMLALAQQNPCGFLEVCIRRCQREVQACRLILRKHERTLGVLRQPEEIAADYRVQPFAVLFHWRKNPGMATSVLYAPDDRPGKLLARPYGVGVLTGNFERDVRGEDARQGGRYSLEEFGFEMAMRRTLNSWRVARAEHALHIDFEGIRACPELSGRRCYVFHRHHYARSEESDGAADLMVYIDCETWLQTGSILKNSAGELLGQDYFDEVQINPPFKPARFQPEGLAEPPPGGLRPAAPRGN
jgi:hypothetical protein